MIVLPREIAEYLGAQRLAEWGDTAIFDAETDDAAPVQEARFYVPSYMAGPKAFEVMERMPLLEVCQLPTAGYEHALEHLPAGVTLCNAAGVHDASTAELAVGLILTSLRRLDDMARAMPSLRTVGANTSSRRTSPPKRRCATSRAPTRCRASRCGGQRHASRHCAA